MMAEGFRAWLEGWVVLFPALVSIYLMTTATLYVLRRESRALPVAATEPLSVSVLVPARNEEAMLAECLEALLASDYPLLEIHVVSDGSTDRTCEIARSFALHGVELHEISPNRGKSRALQIALNEIHSDLVMIVDSDTLVEPDTVREMARVFADPQVAGASANIRVAEPRGLLALLQAVEYASIIGLVKRANGAWGGLFTVSGAACCFRTEAVRKVGGFESSSVTEDIELSWRLQRAGGKLVYAPLALAHVRVPRSLGVLWRQRTRWSQGLVEVLRRHGAVWRHERVALGAYAVEALLSMSWVALLALSLATSLAVSLLQPAAAAPWTSFGLAHALSMTLFVCQSATAAILDSHTARVPWRAFPLVALYPLYFLVVVMPSGLVGWSRGLFSKTHGRWERSARA